MDIKSVINASIFDSLLHKRGLHCMVDRHPKLGSEETDLKQMAKISLLSTSSILESLLLTCRKFTTGNGILMEH